MDDSVLAIMPIDGLEWIAVEPVEPRILPGLNRFYRQVVMMVVHVSASHRLVEEVEIVTDVSASPCQKVIRVKFCVFFMLF